MRGEASTTAPILYLDQYVCAVNKPAGIIVHGDGTGAITLTDLVAAELAERGVASASIRDLQALQRLDRDTTGVALFSLDKATQGAFDALVACHGLESGGIRKRYLAVVRGKFPAGQTVVDRAIGRDRHDSRRMRASRTGKPSLTTVTRLAQKGGYCLLQAELGTGRKHQIRVHLAALGFPIVGDDLYGGARSRTGLMLHAASEEFVHPVTGKLVRIGTGFPSRFGTFFSSTDVPII